MSDWMAGILFMAMGIAAILLRRQSIRDRQKFYDRFPWWPHPPIWLEQVMTASFGLLALALGVFVLVSSWR